MYHLPGCVKGCVKSIENECQLMGRCGGHWGGVRG